MMDRREKTRMKNSEQVKSVIFRTAGNHKWLSLGIAVSVCGAVVTSLIPPLILGKIIDGLTAGQAGGRLCAGIAEELFQAGDRLGSAPVYDAHLGAVAEDFAPVMGYPYHWAGKLFQCLGQLYLQLVLQIAVQSGKGLIQQNDPGSGGQDPSQGAALLLPAGELVRPQVCHGFQLELSELFRCHACPGLSVPNRGGDVLPYGHVGEEGILLKKIPYPPLLGRQVDPGGTVIEDDAVQSDLPLVRLQNTGNAAQRHGFAAAGGPQQRQRDALFCIKLNFQLEGAQLLADVYGKRHHRTPFRVCRCRVSSRFTASKNTAEMATFTSTHRAAPASSLVRQSW